MPRVMADTKVSFNHAYYASSNGRILGPNYMAANAPVEEMAMFWDVESKRAMVLVFAPLLFDALDKEGKPCEVTRQVALPHDAANLVARCWGAPDDYYAGTKGDPMDCSLANLIMPKYWSKKEQITGIPERPFKCGFCEWAGKTQGGLTNHINKEHPDRIGKVETNGQE